MPRLLIAYDASQESRRAIRAAGELFPGAHAVILSVAEGIGAAEAAAIAGPGAPAPPPVGVEPEEERAALAAAEEGLREAEAAGLHAVPATASGSGASMVAQAILDAADEHRADVVVVGSRGRSGLRAALLGSVSNGVVHQAHHPVLVIPHGA